MLKLTIAIQGKTEGDLAVALEQVQKQVEGGFTSGGDRNDSGRYYFEIEGEEEVSEDESDE